MFACHTVLGYSTSLFTTHMAHTIRDQTKLLNRVRRIKGQVVAIERALESEAECTDTLQLIAACRGAINSLMAEVLEGHVRFHVMDPVWRANSSHTRASEQVIDVIRAYLK
jgi:DNA-binding FrmR family transcriptional regulator